jgi:anthranilate phosphoribosyltransferase
MKRSFCFCIRFYDANITLERIEGFQEALLQLAVPVDLGTNDL